MVVEVVYKLINIVDIKICHHSFKLYVILLILGNINFILNITIDIVNAINHVIMNDNEDISGNK